MKQKLVISTNPSGSGRRLLSLFPILSLLAMCNFVEMKSSRLTALLLAATAGAWGGANLDPPVYVYVYVSVSVSASIRSKKSTIYIYIYIYVAVREGYLNKSRIKVVIVILLKYPSLTATCIYIYIHIGFF